MSRDGQEERRCAIIILSCEVVYFVVSSSTKDDTSTVTHASSPLRDAIAGMDWALGASDRLLVTYGRDGVVKLWR